MFRIAFNLEVLSKYPTKFRSLIVQLLHVGIEVLVIVDWPTSDMAEIHEALDLHDFGMIPLTSIHAVDYAPHGDGKAKLLRELEVDLFFDHLPPRMTVPGDTLLAFVMPPFLEPDGPAW